MQCKDDMRDLKRAFSVNYTIIRDTSELTINNLFPHTHYDITFKDVLYERNITQRNNTRSIGKKHLKKYSFASYVPCN